MRTFHEGEAAAPSSGQVGQGQIYAAPQIAQDAHLAPLMPVNPVPVPLSEGERADLADATRRGSQAMRDFWSNRNRMLANPAQGPASVLTAGKGSAGGQQPGSVPSTAPAAVAAPGEPPAPAGEPAMAAGFSAEALQSRTGGALVPAMLLDAVADQGAGALAAARLDGLWQTRGPEAFETAIAQGLDEVERSLGGREAFDRELSAIGRAANIVDPTGRLSEAIAGSGVLSDRATFTRVQGMARHVLSKAPQS